MPETEVFYGGLTKASVNVVCINRFSWNLALWMPINNVLLMWTFFQNQMFFVGVTQIYTNKGVYLINTILVKEIFYQYSTINNFAKKNIFQW